MTHDIDTTSSRSTGPEADSAAGLLSRLVDDVSALFRSEVTLAKAELSRAAANAKTGITGMAAGGVVLLASLMSLAAAAILMLTTVMRPWLAALIVGAVLAVLGLAMVLSGKKKLGPSAFTLDRTQESLRRDSEIVRRAS